MIAGATERGYGVLGAREGQGLSGNVSLIAERRDLAGIHAGLLRRGINTSLRKRRDGGSCLRVSAHVYNSDVEILELLEAL